ncbi:MAG: mechanosensitive ion channel family protein [Pleomorphochaeta sp.]
MKLLFTLVTEVASTTFTESLIENLKFWQGQGFKAFSLTLLTGILIFIASWIALKIILKSIKAVLSRSKNLSELMVTYIIKIISVIGWIVIIITFLQHIGINMGPLVAGLGVTGVVLGLAFQDSLSNFFAGAMLVINEPFRKGDYIEVGSLSGSVASMDLMCVTLNTPDGKRITMSNNLVWGVAITNYSYTTKRGVSMTVSVPYNADLTICKNLFTEMLNSYPEVLSEPEPIIEVHKLADSSINFLLRPWVKPEDYWKVYWRFQGEVVSKLNEKGINVPFPQLDVHFDK